MNKEKNNEYIPAHESVLWLEKTYCGELSPIEKRQPIAARCAELLNEFKVVKNQDSYYLWSEESFESFLNYVTHGCNIELTDPKLLPRDWEEEESLETAKIRRDNYRILLSRIAKKQEGVEPYLQAHAQAYVSKDPKELEEIFQDWADNDCVVYAVAGNENTPGHILDSMVNGIKKYTPEVCRAALKNKNINTIYLYNYHNYSHYERTGILENPNITPYIVIRLMRDESLHQEIIKRFHGNHEIMEALKEHIQTKIESLECVLKSLNL